jgi:hypothetical protein
MRSIASAYCDNEDWILDKLNCPFIKKIHFTGRFNSPREYNFSTDTLDFSLDINKKKLSDCLDSLKDNKEFDTWLHDRYTSCDGFWSFTPNNYRDLCYQILTLGDELDQSIGALISYLMKQEDEEFYSSIEGYVYDYWSSNGYCGLDYEYVDEV